jgi:hypothetical protein
MAAESQIEKKASAHYKALGHLTFKFTSPSQAGVPDRLFIHPKRGFTLYLEFKAPGKKPTPLQLRMIENLRKRGVPCWWVDNLTRAISMLADFIHSPEKFNEIYRGT